MRFHVLQANATTDGYLRQRLDLLGNKLGYRGRRQMQLAATKMKAIIEARMGADGDSTILGKENRFAHDVAVTSVQSTGDIGGCDARDEGGILSALLAHVGIEINVDF
jgi:hypothetical protein